MVVFLYFTVIAMLSFLLACTGSDSRESTGEDHAPSLESTRLEPRLPSYEAVTVKEGGGVRGTVRLSTLVSALPEIPVLKDQAACGEQTPDPSLELGPGGTVAHAVVSLVGVTQGKVMEELPEPAKLDQQQCVYVPHVQIVPVGTTLDIYNSDPILHNVHAYLNGTDTIFNLAMPIQGFRIQRRLDDPGLVSLKCDAGHTWMIGYIVVQEHPYYALTGTDGSFSIEDVLAGEYRLKVWHESLGETETPVVIEAGATTTVDLELSASASAPS